MRMIIIAASAIATLAIAGTASAKDIERKAQRYGPNESVACQKAKEAAEDLLMGSVVKTGVDPCTCGIGAFTQPGASNRYWCRTVARGRYERRERKPTGTSSPR